MNLRLRTLVLLMYSGFLRFDEAALVQRGHLIFFDDHMVLYIPKSKGDVYRDGKKVKIAKTFRKTCPVKNVASYIERANIKRPEEYLFRAIVNIKKRSFLSKKNRPLSYDRARVLFLNAVKDVGLECKLYGTHSMRSGGASRAANKGIIERVQQRHGRWRSTKA